MKITATNLAAVLALLLLGSHALTSINASPLRASAVASYQDAAPQQEDGWATIKTDEGILFVWNVRGLYFSLAVKGKEIKPLDDPEHIFFSVDGRVLQI